MRTLENLKSDPFLQVFSEIGHMFLFVDFLWKTGPMSRDFLWKTDPFE